MYMVTCLRARNIDKFKLVNVFSTSILLKSLQNRGESCNVFHLTPAAHCFFLEPIFRLYYFKLCNFYVREENKGSCHILAICVNK